MWKESVILWYVSDVATARLKGGYIPVANVNSSRLNMFQPTKAFEKNRLSRPGRTQQHKILPLRHLDTELSQMEVGDTV